MGEVQGTSRATQEEARTRNRKARETLAEAFLDRADMGRSDAAPLQGS